MKAPLDEVVVDSPRSKLRDGEELRGRVGKFVGRMLLLISFSWLRSAKVGWFALYFANSVYSLGPVGVVIVVVCLRAGRDHESAQPVLMDGDFTVMSYFGSAVEWSAMLDSLALVLLLLVPCSWIVRSAMLDD